MSKTGKFLREKEEFTEQEQADIHPFSQVKPKKRKKYLIVALAISTLTIYAFIGYLFFKDFSKEKTVPQEKKTEPVVEKVEHKKEIKKIPIKEFSLDLSDLKKDIRSSLLSEEIPPVSFYKKSENKLSKYNYYILKAKKAEINGRYIDAISFYKKAWSINKKDPEILYRIALLHFKIGYYKGTEKYLKRYLKIKKKDAKALLLLGKSYEKMGNNKKAKLILEEAYFLYPENKDILENLGKLYEKENALIIAKDIYKILADMGYLEGKLGLARVYEKLNDKKSALKIYRELYQNPNISEQLRTKIENKIISLE
ncbi:Tetratricopeptide repeat-containing protein [Persephonella hydrogeniphila]|uniref:Tetratricopeptide repeat-containing protein n=1 Tax=Persephonella hydrogeniphila TaxID=198703 RepID=A0A285NR75_9AQUI|nr:tetratricopeptide repeat protein [Persephonella hydrogeniphila]SNZ11698.1 Tetratricopeptide repeat-containing protein [Persephonella hydrogeniphila]